MMEQLLGLPILASAHGGEIDRLIILTHWLMAFLGVGWGIFFIYALIRFRAGNNPQASYAGVGNHYNTYVETGVIVIEAILLFGFAIPAWGTVKNDFPAEGDAVVVRVVAEQFAWNIHYAGADGLFGRTSIELIDTEINPLGLDSSDPNAADDQIVIGVNMAVFMLLGVTGTMLSSIAAFMLHLRRRAQKFSLMQKDEQSNSGA